MQAIGLGSQAVTTGTPLVVNASAAAVIKVHKLTIYAQLANTATLTVVDAAGTVMRELVKPSSGGGSQDGFHLCSDGQNDIDLTKIKVGGTTGDHFVAFVEIA